MSDRNLDKVGHESEIFHQKFVDVLTSGDRYDCKLDKDRHESEFVRPSA